MDFINICIQPFVDCLTDEAKKRIDFVTSCKKYVKDMGTGMLELNATRIDVENHMEHNNRLKLVIPDHVPGWLKEVGEVDPKVKSIISGNIGTCFSFKTRHRIGKNAVELIQEIKRLTEENSRIKWTDHRIPLGEVDSVKASTCSPSVDGDFESREQTFVKALKALEADQGSRMIALCGMGGVGKTTMMKKLRTVVEQKIMFSLIVEVVIGEKTDPLAIQDAVADNLSIDITERTISARADKLRSWFRSYSDGGKKKILVILDDIWQWVDLKDIGLSPLPKEGVDFKVFLTSRNRDACIRMDVEANSIFDVKLLAEEEAQRLFWQSIKDSGEADLRKLAYDIVCRCQGLPIAIKTIAKTLKGKSKSVWEDALTRLQHHDIGDILNAVFELSYKNLEDEQTKSVLLLCGLYQEDFDIPTEELVRYGWGLKLFKNVYTIRQGRNRLNTCIEQLFNANLLIESNRSGHIKLHDLVLAFVLKMYSKVEHASIVKHGNMTEWPANDTPESCKRISLECKGMEEFPRDFKYPNLSFLKLTLGDESLRFPENFYGLMEKLQVIVYEEMKYPLLPRSLEYSTNLRTLCLHGCELISDYHSIGSLLNLEVLSFSDCSIRKLPSTIGNLKKLKVLDLTGCVDLRIDDGVFKNLVKLEELYMRVADKKAICFTDGNFNELAERSEKLSAIEIELVGNNDRLKRMSFNNLERFRISVGCIFEYKGIRGTRIIKKDASFENTLMLVASKFEILESRINVLFEKTVVLHLQVEGMNDLEDFNVKSLHSIEYSSFYSLRVLNISKCAQLRYLFTRRIVTTLLRLEHLQVSSCDTMQTLIHDEDNGSEPIKFPSLKFLSLDGLPKVAGLCNTGSLIELPQLMELRLDGLSEITSIFHDDNLSSDTSSTMQPFFNEKVAIPKLEALDVKRMNKLCKIWTSKVTSSENVRLKTIVVDECDKLVNLFPRNPMPLLHHLKMLSVSSCRSIKTIFKIDMGCVPETGESRSSSSLLSIYVRDSENLRQEKINIFTPITANNLNLKALDELEINYGRIPLLERIPEELSLIQSNQEKQTNDTPRDIAFSSHLLHTSHQLRTLTLEDDREAQVVFDIESGELPTSQDNHLQLLCSLEDLSLSGMDNMSHVWNCNWNRLFILQQPKSLFQKLNKISINYCTSIKYLFSPLMFKFLSNLKNVNISYCEVMEEIVSNRDDEDQEMATSTFPILERLTLYHLKSLQHIGGGGGRHTYIHNQVQKPEDAVPMWSLCQFSKRIGISSCSALSIGIPSCALAHMQNLQELDIKDCKSMKDVFEIKRVNDVGSCEGSEGDNDSVVSLTTPQNLPNIVPDLRNLRRLVIYGCDLLRDAFPFSVVQSLRKLESLSISRCADIRVIVKEEDENHTTTTSHDQVVVFPCLKFITFKDVPNLESFFLGTNDFRWPVLTEVKIEKCPKMTTFTQGHSDSPMLKYLTSDVGEHSVESGLHNLFRPTAALQQQVSSPGLDGSNSVAISERMPWFYNNLIKFHVQGRKNQRYIIGNNELQHLLKVENLQISYCRRITEIFETSELNNQTHSVLQVREMGISKVYDIKCLWNSEQWTVLKFPNLTTLSIGQCDSLIHVFTISMVASLLQLQDLRITHCPKMEIILVDVEKEQEDDDEIERRSVKKQVEFPCLRSLTLRGLESLKGFCLGMETIHWPSLVTLEITDCREITTFTNGESTTPNLKFINTSFDQSCDATEGVNSFIRTKIEEGFDFGEV